MKTSLMIAATAAAAKALNIESLLGESILLGGDELGLAQVTDSKYIVEGTDFTVYDNKDLAGICEGYEHNAHFTDKGLTIHDLMDHAVQYGYHGFEINKCHERVIYKKCNGKQTFKESQLTDSDCGIAYKAPLPHDKRFKDEVIIQDCDRSVWNNGYELRLQCDGNTVLYKHEHGWNFPIWNHSPKDGVKGKPDRLVMMEDGNLAAFTKDDELMWSSETVTDQKDHEFEFQADGNLVIYKPQDNDRQAIWSSGTSLGSQEYNKPVMWTIYDGETYENKNSVIVDTDMQWSTGLDNAGMDYTNVYEVNKVELRLQDDGNLVLYRYSDYNDENTTPWHIWSTSTFGSGSQKQILWMQADGNLVLTNENGDVHWASGSEGRGVGPYRLIMPKEGFMHIRDSMGFITWTADQTRSFCRNDRTQRHGHAFSADDCDNTHRFTSFDYPGHEDEFRDGQLVRAYPYSIGPKIEDDEGCPLPWCRRDFRRGLYTHQPYVNYNPKSNDYSYDPAPYCQDVKYIHGVRIFDCPPIPHPHKHNHAWIWKLLKIIVDVAIDIAEVL